MALSIKPKFNKADVDKIIRDRLDRIEQVVIEKLQLVGEKFVTNARNNADFTDRTGHLRGSIGYMILKNGQEIQADFGNGESLGRNQAVIVLEEVKQHFPKGFTLIVVAGMEYAAAVESLNYDVLTSSSLLAEAELKKAFQALTKKIGKMK